MGRKKRNSEDPLDTNRRQSQTRAGQDDQARVDERPISANPGLKFVPLFVFTFQCIAGSDMLCYHFFFRSKGTTVFCKLELHVVIQENLA